MPARLLLPPDKLLHKAAALLLAVEKAGRLHALLPVEPDLVGPGDEAVEGVGGELFAAARVGQAEQGAQACLLYTSVSSHLSSQ